MKTKISPFYTLRFANFRFFWIALFLSQVALQMELVAINWHIYQLTRSPIYLGFIGLAGFIPTLLLSLFGGVAADRFNRKKMMVVSQTIMALSVGILAIATPNRIYQYYRV